MELIQIESKFTGAEVRQAVTIHDMINFVYSDLEGVRDLVETSGSCTVTARGMVTARVKSRVSEHTFSAGIHLFFRLAKMNTPHSIDDKLVLQVKIFQGQLDKFIILSLEREQMKSIWDKYIHTLKNNCNWTIDTAPLIPFHLSENPPSIIVDCCGHCHG